MDYIETQAKFIQDRIQSVERNMGEICRQFAGHTRKIARVRDMGDDIATAAINYAESEVLNKSLVMGLAYFADCMTLISDYGDVRVQLHDSKIVGKIAGYENYCKQFKEQVKDIYSAREKEMNKRRQLERIRESNPRNRQKIIQAETELVKATAEMSKFIHDLEEKAISFERQKLHDIKVILLDFIAIEIGYHVRAIETLSKTFHEVSSINEQTDTEEFKKNLLLSNTIHRQAPVPGTSLFNSAGTLGSLGAIFSSTHNKKTPGIPDLKQKSQCSKSEETLDSMKQPISDSEETENDSEDISENATSSEEKPSTSTKK
ncbi:hypothetical protein NQ314_006403 [Rhamnusium bicolor]|uniref:Protein FAM92A1 n=1 Tax=Rhamnusium bicolor TaxID=1586634 RepID=A0AAV8Z4Z4_9CUCU|nr:hypothetical protein NQ314_006403 [Rhamnusium bicolor]